jgi:hypothetical protein
VGQSYGSNSQPNVLVERPSAHKTLMQQHWKFERVRIYLYITGPFLHDSQYAAQDATLQDQPKLATRIFPWQTLWQVHSA